MDVYGLIGKDLSHSFSPEFFKQKFHRLGINAEYKLFDIDSIDKLPNIITNNPKLKGLNVTIPYKRSLNQYMDYCETPAQISGSINTIKIIRDENKTSLHGYNTDVIGFEKTLKPLLKGRKDIRAMILGTGGSANSVAYVLRKLGILFCFISRNPSKLLHSRYTWIDSTDLKNNHLIINTTPVGMFPKETNYPTLPYQYISDKHILYDLIYNPNETIFLKNGREQGAICVNGKQMLEIQANASWDIWNK